MSEELKPVRCGCGGAANVETAPFVCYDELWGEPESQYVVWCNSCGIGTRVYNTKAEAITAWNRAMGADQFRELTKKIERTAKVNVHYRDESVVFGFCECGQAVNTYSTYCPMCGARLEWE